MLAGALSAGGVVLFMSVLEGRRRRAAGRSTRGRAAFGVGARRYITHAGRRRRVGRVCLRRLTGRRGAGLVHAGVVQAIEQRAHHHCDGDREHRDLGAAGGTLGQLGIGLQLVVETVEAGLMADFFIAQAGAVGIVRIGLVCHDGFLR